jgi:hypothetical protein
VIIGCLGDSRRKKGRAGPQATLPRVAKAKHRSGWIIVVFFILAGCAISPSGEEQKGVRPLALGRPLVLWLLSDIQPPTPRDRGQFERAIADVKAHVGPVDLAVIAGDLLAARSQAEAFTWFLAARNRSQVSHWYEIAGNHDVRSEPLFHRTFPGPAHYAVEVGNILLLLLSDESSESQTDISDTAFGWWRDMVVGNQDRILITVTHGQLKNSGLLGSTLASRRIAGSERFEAVLREARVALWASGHTHLPQGLPGTVSIQPKLGGTCFVNVSAIEAGLLRDSQSRFLLFEEGSDRAVLRSRNHSQGRFEEDLDISVRLGKAFVWTGEAPRVRASAPDPR